MTVLSTKTIALTTLIALGSVYSGSAHANILRTNAGVPVLTKDGNCVLTGTDGATDCPANTASMVKPVDQEKTVYFDFNKSTLTPHAKHRLDHLAWYLRHQAGLEEVQEPKGKHKHHHHHVVAHEENITIVGYADRIGDAGYNEKLALKRAQAVRDYLISKGVKAKHMEVRSLGKTAPRAECSADLPRAKLIHCLREDRRVEIEFGPAQ